MIQVIPVNQHDFPGVKEGIKYVLSTHKSLLAQLLLKVDIENSELEHGCEKHAEERYKVNYDFVDHIY